MSSLTDFREIMEQVFNGKIIPLEQAREAYARYERDDQVGKIVLKMAG